MAVEFELYVAEDPKIVANIENAVPNDYLIQKQYDSSIDGTIVSANSNVKNVADFAFYKLAQLVDVNMPNVDTVGESAFLGCASLQVVNMPSVAKVGGSAFQNCTALRDINMPYVHSLAGGAFSSCKSLQSIDMTKLERITGSGAFRLCTSLKRMNLPNLEYMNGSEFYNCYELVEVDIPKANSLSSEAFYGCNSLKIVKADSAKSVGSRAFYRCSSLETVSFPNVYSQIRESAFTYCTSLRRASFGTKAMATYNTPIYEGVFAECDSLKTIVLGKSDNTTNYIFSLKSLSAIPAQTHVYVPDGQLDTYKTATNWAAIADRIHPQSELPADEEA